MKEFLAFMKQWSPEGNPVDSSVVLDQVSAQMIELILQNCGDDLTRENVLKQVTNIRNQSFGLLLPGVTVQVTPDDDSTVATFRAARFDGKRWVIFGEPIHAVGK